LVKQDLFSVCSVGLDVPDSFFSRGIYINTAKALGVRVYIKLIV